MKLVKRVYYHTRDVIPFRLHLKENINQKLQVVKKTKKHI